MYVDPGLARRARVDAVVVEIGLLLRDPTDKVVALVSRQAPDWLIADLANDGLQIFYDGFRWILTALDE
ncbi:hypothetical protein RPSD_52400 (plasmid) [Ralstonia solanacearum]|nr:hypothetical protein RPSD_52400 [Ralstonia solanacearum]